MDKEQQLTLRLIESIELQHAAAKILLRATKRPEGDLGRPILIAMGTIALTTQLREQTDIITALLEIQRDLHAEPTSMAGLN